MYAVMSLGSYLESLRMTVQQSLEGQRAYVRPRAKTMLGALGYVQLGRRWQA